MKSGNTGKELYRQLCGLPWEQLWTEDVARFNRATARGRFDAVSVIRAVGVVFAESGPAQQRDEVEQWLRKLLQDPGERSAAMAALPKTGARAGDEAELLALLRTDPSEREAKYLGQTLDKIGGEVALEILAATAALPAQTEQKVRASVARRQSPSAIRINSAISDFAGLRIHLRGRAGLEGIVRDEVEAQGTFRILDVQPGLVAITALAAFTSPTFLRSAASALSASME